MASALPIVATNVGGIQKLIDHKVNGLLVGSKVPEDLAQAIKMYFDDPTEAYGVVKKHF